MKSSVYFFITAVILLLSSCAGVSKFPVSSVVPAAEITATKKKDRNNNYTVEVTAKYLAEPARLSPAKSVYSLWIVTEEGVTKNLGQLRAANSKKSIFKTVTPFPVAELFITAEDAGNLSYPSGVEITRYKFRKRRS